MIKKSALLLFVFTFHFSLLTLSHAQDSQLILAPAIIRTTIDDPNTPIEATYHLKNTTSESLDVVALPQAISSHDPIGRPILSDIDINSNTTTSQIQINPKEAILFPGEEATFVATIHPQFLKAGGNYAAIIFKQIHQQADSSHNIIPVISGLLQIRNPNGEDRRLHLTTTNLPQITTKPPKDILVEFENPGNIDVTPYGDVLASSSVHGSSNVGYLNQKSNPVYPGQTQQIQTTIDQPIKPFVIDSLTYSISGHDEINSLHFNHQQNVIYISPIIIFLFILIMFITLILILNKKHHFISRAEAHNQSIPQNK